MEFRQHWTLWKIPAQTLAGIRDGLRADQMTVPEALTSAMTLRDITECSAVENLIICHIFFHIPVHTNGAYIPWEYFQSGTEQHITHKQKSAVSAVDYDWKVLSVFVLTNMIFHIQTLESFQGQEISMKKSTKDFLLSLSISKYGFRILNLDPHLKTEFLIQVFSKAHSHKKHRGKKKYCRPTLEAGDSHSMPLSFAIFTCG